MLPKLVTWEVSNMGATTRALQVENIPLTEVKDAVVMLDRSTRIKDMHRENVEVKLVIEPARYTFCKRLNTFKNIFDMLMPAHESILNCSSRRKFTCGELFPKYIVARFGEEMIISSQGCVYV